MINSLVERVNSTQLNEKDPEAAALLARGLSGNPDAMYILAQSVLVQNIALEQAHGQLAQAQEQIAQLQQQAQHPSGATSFLGSLLGHREAAPPPPPPLPPSQAYQPAVQGGYQPVYSPQVAPEYQAPYQAPYQGSNQGLNQGGYAGQPYVSSQPSFLRSAAQTAAGVAAGALAFEGVEALLHGGFGHPGMGMGMGGWGMPGVGFGMGPGMGGGFGRPIEETVVNNYYEGQGSERFEHERGGEHHFSESAGAGSAQLSDAGWDGNADSGNDTGSGWDDSSVIGDDGSFDGDGGVL